LFADAHSIHGLRVQLDQLQVPRSNKSLSFLNLLCSGCSFELSSCVQYDQVVIINQIARRRSMNSLSNVVRQLQQERARILKDVERLDAALTALNGSKASRSNGSRRLSTAARARIAAAQRARWAKVRSNAQPKLKSVPKKRTISAVARKRIAARNGHAWTKFKPAKEKKAA
jgi:hypothetical protein